MNDRDRFLVTYYNPETLTRESSGVFGVADNRFFTTPFLPVTLDSGVVNPIFLEFAFNIQTFYCECDRGFASFRCENRATKQGEKQYWYAYKKVNGKTNRFNIGDLTKLNFDVINEAVAVVCGLQVAQKKSATKKPIATVAPVDAIADFPTVLAGHGKYKNHLQPSLPLAVTDDIDSLKREQAFKNMSLAVEIAKERIAELEGMLARSLQVNDDAMQRIATNNDILLKKEIELTNTQYKLLNTEKKLDYAIEGKDNLEETLAERDEELLKTHQKLLERNETIVLMRNETKDAIERIFQLECESSKRENDVARYAYMYDQHSKKIFAYQALIEQYCAMTTGKTKKGNPRYAYLIDFLADIDKIY
jgi:hypothetical protein